MINYDFLIFHILTTASRNQLRYRWAGYPPVIPFMNWGNNWTVILVEINIGVIVFKPVHMIGWWIDTNLFMNENIFILYSITDIQYPGSESMHRRDINVDSEGFIMYHRTLGLIKINSLDMITPICTVVCKIFPCIITVTLLNTWSNEWTEDLCSIREISYRYGIWKRVEILFFSYYKNKDYFHHCF